LNIEHLNVFKSLSLIGESKNTTIIDGSSFGTIIQINTDNVQIANFTVRNAGEKWGVGYPDSCILASFVTNVSVESNTILNGIVGVFGYSTINFTIRHNIIYDCGLMAIHLDGYSSNCRIMNNRINNSLEGIELERSEGNIITENILHGNNVSIVLNQCEGSNAFRGNQMFSDWHNLIVWGLSLDAFLQDIDTSNIVNNKTVYYQTNNHNVTFNASSYPDLGYLAVVNCSQVTIRDLDLSYNKDGLLLAESVNCTLENITIKGNLGQPLHGGLTFFRSNDNLLVNNTISNNTLGISFYRSENNTIYKNSFIGNNVQVISNFHSPFSEPTGVHSNNFWDNGYPAGGNYWSDYEKRYSNATELDGSGIWDTPYIIDENNQDNYPLIPEFPSLLILPLFMLATLLAALVYVGKDQHET